jgi:hypothetical protein
MADVEEPVACEACGRQLPAQQGRGRRRRYCDATCRSAARRQRDVARGRGEPDAKAFLTAGSRHEELVTDGPSGRADPVTARILGASRRLAEAVRRPGRGGAPLTALAAARELSAATAAALQEGVDQARAAGHSWREIGDVLGTTRQAAFQRFGRPVDPGTGTPMARDVPAGAAERAIAFFTVFTEGRWDDARSALDDAMREQHDVSRLESGWTRTCSLIGRFEGMGEPFAHRAGEDTMVDVPLHFEAGEAVGLVRFDQAGKIAGLGIRPAPEPRRPR